MAQPTSSSIPPEELASDLVATGASPADLVDSLLEHFPELDLGVIVSTGFAAYKDVPSDMPSPTAFQQGLGQGLAAARAANPSLVPVPPPPVVTGPAGRWILPVYDPNPQTMTVTTAPGAVVVNTGSWLTFVDPVTGAVQGVAQGGSWVPTLQVAGGLVIGLDSDARMLYAFHPDGSQAWSASAPSGDVAADGGNVFVQTSNDGSIVAYDATSGAITWMREALGAPPTAGLARTSLGAGNGLVLYATDGPVAVHAVRQDMGADAWTWTLSSSQLPSDSRWTGGSIFVGDNFSFAPLLPVSPSLNTATGELLPQVVQTTQDANLITWALYPAGPIGVMGWRSSTAYLFHPVILETSFFPSESACRHPPDPNMNGQTYPTVVGNQLFMTYLSGGDHTEVRAIALPPTMWNADLGGVERFSVSGLPGVPAADASSLYVLLEMPNAKVPVNYLVALPLT